MTAFIGIDPGLSGCVAVIGCKEPRIYDTPTFLVHCKTKDKREYDIPCMRSILEAWQYEPAWVFLELVHAMPGQGVTSMFSFGRGLGLWEGMLAALKISYTLVAPQRWQKELLDGMPKGKGASLIVAKRLFPSVSLDRVKDHGRADALLLAEYGRRSTGSK